jgi:hypothetical protein
MSERVANMYSLTMYHHLVFEFLPVPSVLRNQEEDHRHPVRKVKASFFYFWFSHLVIHANCDDYLSEPPLPNFGSKLV